MVVGASRELFADVLGSIVALFSFSVSPLTSI